MKKWPYILFLNSNLKSNQADAKAFFEQWTLLISRVHPAYLNISQPNPSGFAEFWRLVRNFLTQNQAQGPELRRFLNIYNKPSISQFDPPMR